MRRARPRWVMGLRSRLEEAFSSGAVEGTLLGRAELRGTDMVEVVDIAFVPGKLEGPSFEVSGGMVEFKFPVRDGEGVEDVYYRLMGKLSWV